MKSINQCNQRNPVPSKTFDYYQIFPDGFQANAKISIVSIIVSEKRKLLSITLACNEWILT